MPEIYINNNCPALSFVPCILVDPAYSHSSFKPYSQKFLVVALLTYNIMCHVTSWSVLNVCDVVILIQLLSWSFFPFFFLSISFGFCPCQYQCGTSKGAWMVCIQQLTQSSVFECLWCGHSDSTSFLILLSILLFVHLLRLLPLPISMWDFQRGLNDLHPTIDSIKCFWMFVMWSFWFNFFPDPSFHYFCPSPSASAPANIHVGLPKGFEWFASNNYSINFIDFNGLLVLFLITTHRAHRGLLLQIGLLPSWWTSLWLHGSWGPAKLVNRVWTVNFNFTSRPPNLCNTHWHWWSPISRLRHLHWPEGLAEPHNFAALHSRHLLD